MKRLRQHLLACLLLLASPLLVAGSIYSYTDESGQRVYTDKPPAGQTRDLRKPEPRTINSLPAPAPRTALPHKKPTDSGKQASQKVQVYQQLHILEPADDSSVRANDRILHVRAESTPPLLPGHSYQLWLDGAARGEPSQASNWSVTEVDRGTHSIQVHILNEAGESIAQSGSHRIHLRQISLAERRLARPCTLADYGQRPECPLEDKPAVTRPWWRMGL